MPATGPRLIDLALQGGGSHGAFTWGVLDALLEDGRLRPDGVSGTSAGAMNAALLACGWARGEAAGARQALADFWAAVAGTPGCWGGTGVPALPGGASWPAWLFNRGQWPAYAAWESWLRLFSPAQLNPFKLDPLRDILRAQVDEEALRDGPLKVFVTATSVRTGQPRVFSGQDLSVDALLASACLPQTAQTVVTDGEPYWDGGFSGNPALWPLVYGTDTDDVLLVQTNPRVQDGIPQTAADIADRVNEITFNASLVAELRAIAFVQTLVKEQRVDPGRHRSLRLHRVADEAGLAPLDASSKLNADPRLLQHLFHLGRAAATSWLQQHAGAVGQRSTLDIHEVFLADRSPSAPSAPSAPAARRPWGQHQLDASLQARHLGRIAGRFGTLPLDTQPGQQGPAPALGRGRVHGHGQHRRIGQAPLQQHAGAHQAAERIGQRTQGLGRGRCGQQRALGLGQARGVCRHRLARQVAGIGLLGRGGVARQGRIVRAAAEDQAGHLGGTAQQLEPGEQLRPPSAGQLGARACPLRGLHRRHAGKLGLDGSLAGALGVHLPIGRRRRRTAGGQCQCQAECQQPQP